MHVGEELRSWFGIGRLVTTVFPLRMRTRLALAEPDKCILSSKYSMKKRCTVLMCCGTLYESEVFQRLNDWARNTASSFQNHLPEIPSSDKLSQQES